VSKHRLVETGDLIERRDVARVMMALRVEFSTQDHPVGRELKRISETLVKRCARLINAGRRDGSIPPGPPARAAVQNADSPSPSGPSGAGSQAGVSARGFGDHRILLCRRGRRWGGRFSSQR
jgi:hypothetical protein